jgi:hypothetical protein
MSDIRTGQGTVAPNPNVVGINRPIADVNSLAVSVGQIQQGMESLGGTRGDPMDRACTLNDLVKLGLVTLADLRAALR